MSGSDKPPGLPALWPLEQEAEAIKTDGLDNERPKGSGDVRSA